MVLNRKKLEKIVQALKALGYDELLLAENAGRAVAEEINQRFGERSPGRVCVLCGRGLRGSFGISTARHLLLIGLRAEAYVLKEDYDNKAWEMELKLLRMVKEPISKVPEAGELDGCEVIVDAIADYSEPSVSQELSNTISYVNNSNAFLISIDFPSGVDPESGEKLGEAVSSDLIVVLQETWEGFEKNRGLAKEVTVKEAGIPIDLLQNMFNKA